MGSGKPDGQDDVVDSLLPTRRDVRFQPATLSSSITRWLSSFLHLSSRHPYYLPGYEPRSNVGHFALPATPADGEEDVDPFDSAEVEQQSHGHHSLCRQRRRPKRLIIIWLSGVVSLLVWAYAWDVESSWTALETQWSSVSPAAPSFRLTVSKD